MFNILSSLYSFLKNKNAMNDKDSELMRIAKIVTDCCVSEVRGEKTFSIEDVIGESRMENVKMTRTILVCQLLWAGFTYSTIAMFLNRNVSAIRKIVYNHSDYLQTSRAYRIALSEATIKCKGIEAHGL